VGLFPRWTEGPECALVPIYSMNLPPIILASASPRRAELLRELDLEFEVVPSDAEEVHNEALTATEVAEINSYRKARAVAKRAPDSLVIGMDTLVALGTRLFSKPTSMKDAERMVGELQGQTHHVVTGVCLLHLRRHRQRIFADRTEVTFRSMGPAQIRRYLEKIQPLDKAGGYAIQDHGELVVERIEGSFSNVVGLPLERLREELERFAAG
jgi:septum formation protein